MAGVSDDYSTSICSHCDRAIPSSNIDLHFAHCSRNLEKCKVCGDMVPRKLAEEHYLSTHAPVSCSLCSETMDRDILDVHKGENCPQRIATCEYCEFPLPAVDLLEHQEVCGNRTELCHMCHKYIRLRERHGHESGCTGFVNNVAEPSRLKWTLLLVLPLIFYWVTSNPDNSPLLSIRSEHKGTRTTPRRPKETTTRSVTKTPTVYYCNNWDCSSLRFTFLPEKT